MKCYLLVVLICISLMASDAEHPFIYFWALCMSSLEKCLFKSFDHLSFNWVFCLPRVESREFFIYFGDQTLVQDIIGKHIFSCNWFPFHFADVFFSCAEAFYFDEVHLFILSFVSLALGDISVKTLLHEISEIFLPMFSSPIRLLWYHELYLRLLCYLELYLSLLSILSLFWCSV